MRFSLKGFRDLVIMYLFMEGGLFSKSIDLTFYKGQNRKQFDKFRPIWTSLDQFEQLQTSLNNFRQV